MLFLLCRYLEQIEATKKAECTLEPSLSFVEGAFVYEKLQELGLSADQKAGAIANLVSLRDFVPKDSLDDCYKTLGQNRAHLIKEL